MDSKVYTYINIFLFQSLWPLQFSKQWLSSRCPTQQQYIYLISTWQDLSRFYLFIYLKAHLFERQGDRYTHTERNREREKTNIFHRLVYSVNAHNIQGRSRIQALLASPGTPSQVAGTPILASQLLPTRALNKAGGGANSAPALQWKMQVPQAVVPPKRVGYNLLPPKWDSRKCITPGSPLAQS